MSANGKLTAGELVTVDGWGELTPSAARAYLAAAAYIFAFFGIRIIVSNPLGFYRTFAQQQEAKRKYGILAATPGYSTHGWALAFDINNITAVLAAVGGQAKLDAIMARFGFVRDAPTGTGGVEQWHYRLVAIVDLAALNAATELHEPIPAPPIIEGTDNDMLLLNCTDISSAPNGTGKLGDTFVFIYPNRVWITKNRDLVNFTLSAMSIGDMNWYIRGSLDAAGKKQKATDWSGVAIVDAAMLRDYLADIAGLILPTLPNGDTDYNMLADGFRWPPAKDETNPTVDTKALAEALVSAGVGGATLAQIEAALAEAAPQFGAAARAAIVKGA